MESFAGVGYPFQASIIKQGDTMLDIGAGAGTDIMLAALLTGKDGKAYGLDMTKAKHEKLHLNIAAMDLINVIPLLGNAEELPLDDESIEVVTSSGVLNLLPDKPKAFSEIHRVLRRGGKIQISDIVVSKNGDSLEQSRNNPELWAECIVNAVHQDIYLEQLAQAGFLDLNVLDHIDYFAGSNNASTRNVATHSCAESITIAGI